MQILFDITVIFAVSVAVLYVCGRLKVPSIVGLLLSGLIAGPSGLGLVKSAEEVEQMAELGVLLLLFALGIEFSLDKLLRARRLILLAGVLQVVFTVCAVFGLASLAGVEWNQAVFMGFLFSLSSTAIVISVLQDRAEIDSHHGRIALAILIFQDIAVIPMMLFVPFLSGEETNASAFVSLFLGIALVVAVLLLARFVVPRILDRFAKSGSSELFLISILLICFATAGLTYELGLKLALGAFLAGLIVSESDYSLAALGEILPFKKVFTSLFFVSIGMLVNLDYFGERFATIALATGAVMALKVLIIMTCGLILALPLRAVIIAALSLSMVGEFAFILSDVGFDAGLLTEELFQLFLAVSVLSMGLSPFVIQAARRVSVLVAKIPLFRLWQKRIPQVTEIEPRADEGDNRLVTIIGYGVNGRNLAKICENVGIPYSVMDFNPTTVQKEREAGVPITYGDATNRSMLKKAGADKADVIVIAISQKHDTAMIVNQARTLNRNAYIIVRTRFVSEVDPLLRQGANEVVPEEFETSIRIAVQAMRRFDIKPKVIRKYLEAVRGETYQVLRRQFKEEGELDAHAEND